MAVKNVTSLELELQKELGGQHILFNKKIKIIGKREDCDDVVCEILDTDEIAVVHLTWSGKREHSYKFPTTEIFKHWTNFYEEILLIDNIDFEN